MNHLRTYILAAVFCLLASVSCIDRPESVLSDEEMVDLLVDVHRSEGLLDLQSANGGNRADFQQAVMASVLVKHGVTREQYDSSLMWYAKHLRLFVRVYSHVDERLNEEYEHWSRLVADTRDFDLSEAGDSVELWTLNKYLVLDAPLHTTLRHWEIEADSNYQAGDTLRWQFDVARLTRGQKLLASMAMRPRKEDFDRLKSQQREQLMTLPVGSASLLVEEDGPYQFVLVPDSAKAFGSIVLDLAMISPDSVQSPTFLHNISLKRYHRHD